MAWRRLGDKPLSEPMMVSLLTYICVTRPQWDINIMFNYLSEHFSYKLPSKEALGEAAYPSKHTILYGVYGEWVLQDHVSNETYHKGTGQKTLWNHTRDLGMKLKQATRVNISQYTSCWLQPRWDVIESHLSCPIYTRYILRFFILS